MILKTSHNESELMSSEQSHLNQHQMYPQCVLNISSVVPRSVVVPFPFCLQHVLTLSASAANRGPPPGFAVPDRPSPGRQGSLKVGFGPPKIQSRTRFGGVWAPSGGQGRFWSQNGAQMRAKWTPWEPKFSISLINFGT